MNEGLVHVADQINQMVKETPVSGIFPKET